METHVLHIDDPVAVPTAVNVLRRGGLVIYPTDTQYGIGADALNPLAVAAVFVVKQRPLEKKVLWAVCDDAMAERYVYLTPEQQRLVRTLMPGPFSLIVNGQGFRIPDHPVVQRIIASLDHPITTTSANRSDHAPLVRASDLLAEFNGQVDLILDGGERAGPASTVFRWEDRAIVRQGPVSEARIQQALAELL